MKKSLVWAYTSQFLQYGSAFLVLPFLLHNLSQIEMGMWYLFMAISLLAGMLEMGFSQSLARSYVYVLSGADRLQKDGLPAEGYSNRINRDLLASIHFASKRIYLIIALGGLFLLLLPGTYYIWYVNHDQIAESKLLVSWFIFGFSVFISLYSKHYIPLMQGSNRFEDLYKSNALSNIIFIAITAILLSAGFGLLGVSIAFLTAAIARFILSHFYSLSYELHSHIKNIASPKEKLDEILVTLWPNVWRQGLVAIGAFLIIRANTIISSLYLGLEDTAVYSLSLQMFAVIQSISLTFFNIKNSEISTLVMKGERGALKDVINESLIVAILVFFVGFTCAIFIAPNLLELLKSNTTILPSTMLLVMGMMIFLEIVHTMAATVIASSNQVPFVKAAILSGIAICIGTIICFEYVGLSIWWLIMTQFIVQLSYNNWKWPLLVYRRYYI
jgi:O-antigen/teichoic acid export membrane protein